MSEFKAEKRIKTTHKVLARVERRRRPRIAYRDFPASFVTQVMVERARTSGEPTYILPPRNPAVEAYGRGARITARRAPIGLTHAEVA